MTHKTEVDLIIPNIEDLCCINCKVNPLEMQHPIIKTLFHCQTLTCRLIIHMVRCCIASPSSQAVQDLVHVIVSKRFYFTGKLQKFLADLKVQFTDPEPVHPKIYEACLKYTFTFKIGPYWNIIGNSYVRGMNFISLPSTNIDAVEWNILYKDNDTRLQIAPMKINLHPLNLETLPLTPNILNNFMTNPNCTMNSIDLTLFRCPWVYVLPKLTKAKVVRVSKTLPENCPFENYNDLRRHWKNMYSYRLPKTAHGILFYEVVFPVNPNQYFTYPDICILSKMPEFLMCENKNEVTKAFINDLAANVHSVCNEVIKIGHLYPELNIEYSCVFKRKRDNNNESNFDETKSSFFNTPRDNVIKPSNEKVKLSSLFTFKGSDKTSTPNTQKILSIMGNQKQKRKSTKQMGNKFTPPVMNDISEENWGAGYFSQKFSDTYSQPKTVIPNTDDICSFYDIPSMYPTSSDHSFGIENQSTEVDEQNKNHLSSSNINLFKKNFDNDFCINQWSKPKPIIKSIENVNFDLSGIRKIRSCHEINNPIIKYQQHLQSKRYHQSHSEKDLFEQTKYFNTSATKIENRTQQENVFHNDELRQLDQNMQQNSDIKNQQHNQLNFPANSSHFNFSNFASQIKTSNIPVSTDTDEVESNKVESCDDIRSLLTKFDSYNIHLEDDKDFETTVYNQCKKLPFSSESNNDLQEKNSSEKSKDISLKQNILDIEEQSSRKLLFPKSETKQYHQNDLEYNMDTNTCLSNSSQSSSSLLDKFNKKRDSYSHDSKRVTQNFHNFNSWNKKVIDESQSLKSMTKIYEGNQDNAHTSNDSHFPSFTVDLTTDSKKKHRENSINNEENLSIKSKSLLFKTDSIDQLEEKLSMNSPEKFEFKHIDQGLDKDNFCENDEDFFEGTPCDETEELINKRLLHNKTPELSPIHSSNKKCKSSQKLKVHKSVEYNLNNHHVSPCNVLLHTPELNLSEKPQKISSPESNQFNHKLQEQNSNTDILRTPSLTSMFTSDDELDNTCVFKNTLHCSIESEEIQKKLYETSVTNNNNNNSHLEEKHELNNSGGDLTSFLSESSNESESDSYGNCKQVYIEALTFSVNK